MPSCEERQRAVPSVATDMSPSLASCALQLSAVPHRHLEGVPADEQVKLLHMCAAKLCKALLFLKKATERRSTSLTMLRYAGAV